MCSPQSHNAPIFLEIHLRFKWLAWYWPGTGTLILPPTQFFDFLHELHIVRERDGNQDADDEQHDEELRQGKTLRIVR